MLSATTAQEAILIAETRRPTMILTDLQLPTLDELLDLLRAHKTLNNMVVAIIDMNEPDLSDRSDVKVLADFEQLDEFLRGVRV